eukprot:g483.t1
MLRKIEDSEVRSDLPIPIPRTPLEDENTGEDIYTATPFAESLIASPVSPTNHRRLSEQLRAVVSETNRDKYAELDHVLNERISIPIDLSRSNASAVKAHKMATTSLPPGISTPSRDARNLSKSEIRRRKSIEDAVSAIGGGAERTAAEMASRRVKVLRHKHTPKPVRVLRMRKDVDGSSSIDCRESNVLVMPNFERVDDSVVRERGSAERSFEDKRSLARRNTHEQSADESALRRVLRSEFHLKRPSVGAYEERKKSVRSSRRLTKWQALQSFVKRASAGLVPRDKVVEMMRLLREIDAMRRQKELQKVYSTLDAMKSSWMQSSKRIARCDKESGSIDPCAYIIGKAVEDFEAKKISFEQLEELSIACQDSLKESNDLDGEAHTPEKSKWLSDTVASSVDHDVADGHLSIDQASECIGRAKRIESSFSKLHLEITKANAKSLRECGVLENLDVELISRALKRRDGGCGNH